ncbi:chitobiase/beta-hexosaminidase C-terminal domain-containing protein [Luteolibacter marinus]|uniref:chitobiase/beta-hexosaminidase C-terminal domain-containing protein n=1 Tax=Luteolibacter marinus TaxID=2776705 RepID=UPI00186850C2|nr:chitobiase/beta-hexosaminidase C-terminal domain-containing protein [Luteolibacter marinus]
MKPRLRPACRVLAFLALITCPGHLRGEVTLNELQSANDSTLLDEDGDPSDWIELLNRGGQAVDLTGWGLSDRSDSPFKWTFPTVTLGAGERLLVWASGKDRTGTDPGGTVDSPDDIPGLVLWLRAEEESYADGQAAFTWTDRSGHGNHGTAPSSGTRPVFRLNRINGKPAFQFTRSSSQEFRLPVASFNGLDTLNDLSLFAVAKWSGSVTSGIFGAWHPTVSTTNAHFEVNSGGEIRFRVGSMDSIRSAAAIATNEWSVLSTSLAGTADTPLARFFKNGQLVDTRVQSPGDTPLSSYQFMAVGSSTSGRNFNGDIAEVLLYDRQLTAAERGFLDNYLGTRYALPGAGGSVEPQLHTNFSIDAAGEDLVLTRPDGTTEDLVPAVAIPLDASYGRSPETGSALAYFAAPTPGQPNAAISYGPPLGKPLLSEPRGFKTAAFTLAITPPDPAASLKYTLDGSEPSETNGFTYSGPIPVSATTVVRAAAFKAGALPVRAIATRSYFFLDDIVDQTTAPAGYPATWGGFTQTSYAISPAIAARPGYEAAMKSALSSFPTLALSIPVDNMFGPSGLYANPLNRDLEEFASAEWIAPDGSLDVQIDAGLRIQGGASRNFDSTPKKSMRLLFKGSYGESRLRVPVLADGGTAMADFNSLVLRADYNNSWLHWDSLQRTRGTSLRDQWMRDSQIAMSGLGSHGNHVHLYLNGRYWGVYNVSERTDAAFTASYLGGDRGDYDAMTHRGVRDGDNIAWNTMRAIAQAGLSSPAQYAAIREYLDVPQFADYMLLNIYGGNLDWPDNNWSATRKREDDAGFRFLAWDAERTLEDPALNRVNLTGSNNPAEFYAALRNNAEFRLLFADRVHRHFFNGGALTPAAAAQRYATRAVEVEAGVFAEHARWGGYRNEIYDRNGPSPVYEVDPHWLAERDRILNDYLPVRTATVLAQLKAANLYPAVDAPVFSQHGGEVTAGQLIAISAASPTIYYTIDGSDPRVEVSGAVSPAATAYAAPLALAGQVTLKARVLSGGVWSALNEADFYTVLPESEFLPAGSGDWTLDTSWSSTPFPNGPGKRALIHAPATGDRNINLRVPVSVGSIRFDETGNLFRNRVRDQLTGNTLTFDGAGQNALIRVDGDGSGYVEFEVLAGTDLAGDLELQVNHPGGNADHGALRLRAPWSGPGGIRKTGIGVASFTGEDKNFTGAFEITRGVVQLTEPATPKFASSVSVASGGQLRLISGSSPGTPRSYPFATPIRIAGTGRGAEIPDDSGFGKLGALRYDPGNGDNHAILPQPVELTAAASIHVDGSLNRLELSAPLLASPWPLTKSGGGTLVLSAANASFDGPVIVENGTLETSGALASPVQLGASGILAGHGMTGTLSGSGTVLLDGKIRSAPSLGGTRIESVLALAGPPDFLSPASAGNGLLHVDAIASPPQACRIYLPNPGVLFRGVLFAPFAVDLASAVRAAACEVYQPDGTGWSLVPAAQVVTVPGIADFGGGPIQGRIVEVRLAAPPASFVRWQIEAFPDVNDRLNPSIGGPEATPFGDGIPNLLRYALGIAIGDPPGDRMPRLLRSGGTSVFSFPFDPGRDDIACLVEATGDLDDWANADVLFDSRHDFPAAFDGDRLVVTEAAEAGRRFYRLRVIQR